MRKGLFITFEGADGSGKTTQLNMLADELRQQGFDVVVTLEPGALDIGSKIRQILLHHKGIVSDNCEMFLFLADRSQHMEELIKPSVEAGKIVLCDRHTDSTLAYQGFGRGRDVELLKRLNDIAVCSFTPDITLLYDIPTEVSQKRLGKEKDRLESIGIEFHKKVRNGYLKLAQEYPNRIKVINADNTIENIYNETKSIIMDIVNKRMRG